MTRIPVEDLVVGGIYVMRARHFSVGIWTGKEFRGVHLQHGRWVIVGEEPWSSGPPSGTAEAIRVLNDTHPTSLYDGTDLVALLLAAEALI